MTLDENARPPSAPFPQIGQRALRIVQLALAGFVLVGAALSLAGWIFDVPRLAAWQGDRIAIQPNAALGLLLTGLATVMAGRHPLALAAGVVVALLGLLTLAQHLTGISFGIDQMLGLSRAWGDTATTAPGRMGVPASTSFSLLGIALILRARGLWPGVAVGALIAVLAVASLSLVGYAFGADPLYDMPRYTAIALQTSTMLTASALALLCAYPAHHPVRGLFEDSGAGVLVRRLVPFALVAPVLLSYVRVRAQEAGLVSTAAASAFVTLAFIAVLCAVLAWSAAVVRRRESALRDAVASNAHLNESLLNADRRKDEFLAMLAHELRNPLAPITNALAIFARSDDDPDRRRRLLDVMRRQVGLLVRLVDDLLDVSRITRGRIELRRSRSDIGDVVARVVEGMQPQAHARGMTLELAAQPVLVHPDADAHRLAQVFGNLVHNALKFTPDGGRIVVEATRDEAAIEVRVSDNGPGIPPEMRERVFELFDQGERSVHDGHSGLGIGLTLVRSLIEMHGGTVRIEAGLDDRGTSVIVRLPAAAEPSAAPASGDRVAVAEPG